MILIEGCEESGSEDLPAYLELLYGIWFCGAAAVPINAKLHPREAAFIIADSGDTQLDSTVYIEWFVTSDPGGGTPGGGDSIPEPASMLIFGLGLAGLGYVRRRRAAWQAFT